jgi:protein O-mannosyl-transferase
MINLRVNNTFYMKKERSSQGGQKKFSVSKGNQPEKQAINNRFADILAIGIIMLLGIIIYSNSFHCTFNHDDFPNIVDNASIRNLSDVNAWWHSYPTRPIAVFTFALNYHFNHFDVRYWHWVNLIIHLINACLVWVLSLLVFSSPALKDHALSKQKRTITLFTALLFVSHPLATQSVTYIVQRMASLAAMFYMLSVVFYICGRLYSKGNLSKVLLFSLAVIAAVLAMLTKENAFTLPFAWVLVEFFLIRKKKFILNFKDYRLYLFMAGSIGIIMLFLLKFSLGVFKPIFPEHGQTYVITSSNYLYTQFGVIIKYIQLLFLPVNQMLTYDFPISYSFFNIRTLLSFLFLMALIILGVFLFKKHRVLSFGIFWFFLTLSIESSFIPIDDVIFEHRTYLPSFGFFLILSSSVYILLYRKYKFAAAGLLILVIVSNSFLTYERNKVWKDALTLYDDNIQKAPNIAGPVSARADIYAEQGRYEDAITDYSKAISINPGYLAAISNRGGMYMITQDFDKALADFNRALTINPKHLLSLSNRGIAYGHLRQWDKALADFSKVISIDPDMAKAYYNRGNAYSNLGRWDKAIGDYSKTIELGNIDKRAYVYRGLAWANLLQWDKAIADYDKALQIDPDFEMASAQREIAYKNVNPEK